jgi:hypothetical protein
MPGALYVFPIDLSAITPTIDRERYIMSRFNDERLSDPPDQMPVLCLVETHTWAEAPLLLLQQDLLAQIDQILNQNSMNAMVIQWFGYHPSAERALQAVEEIYNLNPDHHTFLFKELRGKSPQIAQWLIQALHQHRTGEDIIMERGNNT